MCVLVLIAFLSLAAHASPLYNVVAAGPPNSVATSVGNEGFVAGYSTDNQGNRRAFVFDAVTSVLNAGASALDTAGSLVVGNAVTEAGSRAAVWDGAAMRLLEFADSYALGVNESGQIAGSAVHGGRTSAFVSGDGGTSWIPAGSWSAAYDINNQGQVVGTYQNSRGQFSAFSWSAATGFKDLGSFGAGGSWAQAVNDSGAVAGSSMTRSGYLHAFLHQGLMIDLGTLGGTASAAYDVNRQGHVVGYSFDHEGRSRGFLWRDGIMFDLNQLIDPSSGWTLEAAYGINEKGQIAGTGFLNGERRAFLLDPLSGQTDLRSGMTYEFASRDLPGSSAVSASQVPEPGNFGLVLVAGAVLSALGLSKRRASSDTN